MAKTESPILIAPVAPPLSRHEVSPSRRWLPRPSRRTWTIAAALAVLGSAAAYVFLLLPTNIDPPAPAVAGPIAKSSAPKRNAEEQPTPPFQSLLAQQARERAEQQVAMFAATQLALEDLNVAAWGSAELDAAQDRAAAADLLFRDGDYAGAQREYEGALADLQALLTSANARYDDALAAGHAALVERDQAAATAAFEAALAVRPQAPAAKAGLARAEQLPALAELLREAARATLRGEHDAARDRLQRAKAMDPATAGIDQRLAENRAARVAAQRQADMSKGLAAIDGGKPAEAIAIFDAILARRPGDAAARAGRQQAEQAETLAAIERLRTQAREQAEREQWAAVLAACNEALAIDPTLAFARTGKAQAAERLALLAAMDKSVADPGLLSADDEFAAAQQTAREAAALGPVGPAFAARLTALESILQAAARPVPLVLMSDNATEVTIQLVGAVGTFDRTELALRPGRYVIVGSRDGCRDVRKEILLTATTPPVDIRCTEAILSRL